METPNPLSGHKLVKKVKFQRGKGNLPLQVVRIICSPVLLFIDIFRPRPSHPVFRAFLWFMLVLSLLTSRVVLLA